MTTPKVEPPNKKSTRDEPSVDAVPTIIPEPLKDRIDRLYTDLENSFISFLRDDPTRTTTVPATMAAQHFEYRIEQYIKLQQEALLDRVEKEVIGEDVPHQNSHVFKCDTLKDDVGKYANKCNCGKSEKLLLIAEQRQAFNKLRLEL